MPTTPSGVPIFVRLAQRLLLNSELDYQQTAAEFWGPGLSHMVAKNRVNAHVTRLRQLGIARSLGSNRFEIDPIKLAELSKIPVEARHGR
jgi:hypothetical protein